MDVKRKPPAAVAKLETFFRRTGHNRKTMAAALHVSLPSVSYWMRGLVRPSDTVQQDIATWTGGKVPVESWGKTERRAKPPRVRPAQPLKAVDR